jgi:hypothetical protein
MRSRSWTSRRSRPRGRSRSREHVARLAVGRLVTIAGPASTAGVSVAEVVTVTIATPARIVSVQHKCTPSSSPRHSSVHADCVRVGKSTLRLATDRWTDCDGVGSCPVESRFGATSDGPEVRPVPKRTSAFTRTGRTAPLVVRCWYRGFPGRPLHSGAPRNSRPDQPRFAPSDLLIPSLLSRAGCDRIRHPELEPAWSLRPRIANLLSAWPGT